jgi:hypothetical protein
MKQTVYKSILFVQDKVVRNLHSVVRTEKVANLNFKISFDLQLCGSEWLSIHSKINISTDDGDTYIVIYNIAIYSVKEYVESIKL